MRSFGLLMFALTACGGKDSGGDDAGGTPPDLAGKYNVVVLGVVGCESDPIWIDEWARGPLEVSGAASALVFDFGDDAVFSGDVDGNWNVRFSGGFDWQGATLSITGSGLAQIAESDPGDGSQLAIKGDISAFVEQDGVEGCTVEGPFEATELVGL